MTLLLVTLALLLSWLSGFHSGYKNDEASPSAVVALMALAYALILAAFNI